jgi:hypothetical protein
MAIWFMDGSGEAYDRCQTDSDIDTGDTLVIDQGQDYSDERIVGLAGTWPVAVTVQCGALHTFRPNAGPPHQFPDEDWGDYFSEHQCRVAVAEALNRGWPIRPEFERYAVRAL